MPLMPCKTKTVYCAKLVDDKDLLSGQITSPEVEIDNYYYFLNAEPGAYVMVAASYQRGASAKTGSIFINKTGISATNT